MGAAGCDRNRRHPACKRGHRNRRRTVSGGVVAELPVIVVAPAVDGTSVQQRTRMGAAGCDRNRRRRPSVNAATATGAELEVVVPLPSRPSLLEPQQLTAPVFNNAHVWKSPAVIETAVAPPVNAATATGAELSVVVFVAELPVTVVAPAVDGTRVQQRTRMEAAGCDLWSDTRAERVTGVRNASGLWCQHRGKIARHTSNNWPLNTETVSSADLGLLNSDLR